MEIREIAYQSTIKTNGYFFHPGTRKCHDNDLDPRPHKVDNKPKTKDHTWTDTSRPQQQEINPIEAANTWQQLNPTADSFASLPKDYYHTVTNTYATNITVGNQKSLGMESIFALQSPSWLHDVIITWWLGYWCAKTGGLSNFSITSQGQRNQNQINGQRKNFFATPFFWNYLLDGEIRGANETKYVDIFTCSRMLIPANIKLKHWILACIDFEHKWIAWFDSISEAHEQETRLPFTWLTREHSFNRSTTFDPAEWSLHSGPPPGMQVPLQSNDYDCGIFICLYAAFLNIRLPLSFSQHDTRNVRTWMAHEMIEEGKLLKMIHKVLHDSLLASAKGNSASNSDHSTAISRSTTDTVDTTSTATTTGDNNNPNAHPSHSYKEL
jgi:Ulp1 family protease